jgi:hypothetical protein
MSRSYRKPYCALAGHGSAKEDKRRAVRGLRRTQEQWLRKLEDHNSALAPHRLECTWNNVWCWDRDGKQRLLVPSPNDWVESCEPPPWYQKLQRK